MISALALLKAIPGWAWLALAALGIIAYQQHAIGVTENARDDYKRQSETAQARAASLSNTLSLQRNLQIDQNKVVDDARKLAQKNSALAADASKRVDGMSKQLADLQRDAETRDRATACGSSAAGALSGVLAGLLDESVKRNRDLAEEAERYRAAGLACEASYAGLARRLGQAQ